MNYTEIKNEGIGQDAPQEERKMNNSEYAGSELKINPAFRDQLPPLPEDKYRKLEKDICKRGCFDPIRSWNGYIIDGHNRHKICTENNVEFRTLYLDECFENENQVRIWIIDHQDGRRELEPFTRAELQMEKVDLEEGEQGKRTDLQEDSITSLNQQSEVVKDKCKPYERLAKKAGMSPDTYSKACFISQNAPEEVKEKLRKGETAIKPEYNKLKAIEKRVERQEILKSTEFPKGKYRIIYADPPWEYGPSKGPGGGDAQDEYPTMSFEDICNLPVQDITDETAVLFLWVTTPLIEKGLSVLKSWGFEYKTLFTWDKVRSFFGHYNAVAQEFLLLGTKGSCLPDCNTLPHSVVKIEKTRHSSKPEEFRQLIESMYKYGNKVELFARNKADGWEVFGNEV